MSQVELLNSVTDKLTFIVKEHGLRLVAQEDKNNIWTVFHEKHGDSFAVIDGLTLQQLDYWLSGFIDGLRLKRDNA